MKRVTKILHFILIVLFIGGVALGLLGRAFCTRSNDNYQEIRPESFVPDTIETVLHHEALKQIYVCYNDANCVNVYTEAGEFLWCVATPRMRNSHFELQDNQLIISFGEAYIYDAKNGAFLGIQDKDDLNLNYIGDRGSVEAYIEGKFYFDSFQVYRASADNTLEVVVSRPWWHHIFNFILGWSISFIGAVGIGICIFLEKRKEYKAAMEVLVLKNRKAKFVAGYFKIATVVHLVYSLLGVICAFITSWAILSIMPLALHMILSSIILGSTKDRLTCEPEELQIVNFREIAYIGSFFVAALSVIIATVIAS